MKCQLNEHVEDDLFVTCTASAPAWRMCGLGCKVEIAYCAEHGGDRRAGKEMVEHHAKVHGAVPRTNFFPGE